ncbi:MAG: histidine kinase, partial [Actinomycetota bacterium]|nr:histidine kinase [Actinomycetota bacterium]
MTTPDERVSPFQRAADVTAARGSWRHRGGWKRWVFPSVWLFYLGQTLGGIGHHAHGMGVVAGIAILVVFAAVYVVALPLGWREASGLIYVSIAIMIVLTAAETPFAHEDAFVMCVYIGVVCIAGLPVRQALPALAVITAVAVVTPAVVPSWHAGVDWSVVVAVTMTSFAMYGFFSLVRNNRALTAARAEVARLAAENERSRIARDLHDLLGHSLTTITVKAGLARRLADVDPARAAAEIGEVEALTRSTLADVRAAVSGYRDVSLAGELASAHEVLRAAGIQLQLPRAIDAVPAEFAQLFGWVVREGTTNVVRHSRATSCTISVGATWLEIDDDGAGGLALAGHGLGGLRERVESAGGTLSAGGRSLLAGWTLRVDVPPAPRA